jgi:glycosyltransferase involved in cell wall biosynthesis
MSGPKVAIVTAARDEEEHLPRLIAAMAAQTVRPVSWTIVDTGSTDRTVGIARRAAEQHPWIAVLELPAVGRERGAPIVRAIEAAAVVCRGHAPELLVNVDADVSFSADFLARLAAAFAEDASVGIASGTCYELEAGTWRERFVTGSSAWGATRAYRWECFADVRPLEPRFGWDGIDELRAQARGWKTLTLRSLPFRHHRREGARDLAWRGFAAQGATAHFMGYRPSYLMLRALHHTRRNPAAFAMIGAFVLRALARRPQLDDRAARAYLARQQNLRSLPRRVRESRGGGGA